jgi:hypothetical protein
MNKLPKDKRDKIILVAMATVGVLAAIWFALISNQLKALSTADKDKIEAGEKLAAGDATLKKAAQAEQGFADASTQLKRYEAAMAAPNDMYEWLIKTLSNFRLGYNVEIPQFSREMPAEVGMFPQFPYKAAVFTIQGTAHYHDFGRFLADFENGFPYIRVQNLEMSPLGDQTSTAAAVREKLTFRMDLLTLVRPTAP